MSRPVLHTRCTLEGCDRGGRIRRGYCDMHYRRFIKYGDPGQVDPLFVRGVVPHGKPSGYMNHGCRCDACRAAWAVYWREASHRRGTHRPREVVFAERRAAALARDNHGTETRYTLGCRCDACRAEASRMRRIRRQRKAVAA